VAARRRGRELYAAGITGLRYVIVLFWVLAAVAATAFLPALGETGRGRFGGLVGNESPAIQAEVRSITEFAFPVLARTAVVQRDPDRLDAYAQARAVLRAVAFDQRPDKDPDGLLGALPLTNTQRLFPGSTERGTTAITYLFTSPRLSFARQESLAKGYAQQIDRPDDHLVGVTGTVPARVAQARIISESLALVEFATLAAVVLIVALNFRSLAAPAVTVLAAAVAYLVAIRLLGAAGSVANVTVPSDLEPLVVALLLGVVTDYTIFYVSGLRDAVLAGRAPRDAAARSTAHHTPIIIAAGLTVTAGTASLVVARSDFFSAFGPGLALTVLVALLVSVTLVPAILAILGTGVFWPTRPRRRADDGAGSGPAALLIRLPARRYVPALTDKRVALGVGFACVAALMLAALPLRHADLGLSVVRSLPSTNSVAQAAQQARHGFAPGILSPTVLLIEGPGVTRQRAALARLEGRLARLPHVAGVAGPADKVTPFVLGAVLSRTGNAARYLIILDEDPLGAAAIDDLQSLRDRVPAMLRDVGLTGARASFAGDTALAEEIVGGTESDLWRIALAAALVDLLLLVLFLRALVAPLYLLFASVLAVGAFLGLTVLLFQDVLGADGLTFYVPFAAAVLLVAFGGDYNILGVGHVWEEARTRPLRQAIIAAVPRSTRAITAAGITLAVSFGLLALVPLAPFREMGFVMFVGVLLDALLVRSVLVPCLLVLVGPVSAWPGHRLRVERRS
jgi:RND superfamily putative drug exporter